MRMYLFFIVSMSAFAMHTELTYQPESLQNLCYKKIITTHVLRENNTAPYSALAALYGNPPELSTDQSHVLPKETATKIIKWALVHPDAPFNIFYYNNNFQDLLKCAFTREFFTFEELNDITQAVGSYKAASESLCLLYSLEKFDYIAQFLNKNVNPIILFSEVLKIRQPNVILLERFLQEGGYTWLKNKIIAKKIWDTLICCHGENGSCKANCLKILLEYGLKTDIQIKTHHAEYPALSCRKAIFVSDCVDNFKMLNSIKEFKYPLHRAAYYHSTHLIRYLLQERYCIDSVNKNGHTPLGCLENSWCTQTQRALKCRKLLIDKIKSQSQPALKGNTT